MDEDTPVRWELRRPDLVLHEVEGRFRFDRPRTLLARVDGDYCGQRVTAATVLWRRPPIDEFERTKATERALAKLGLGMSGIPYAERPIVVTIVVRPGDCWWSFDEREAWLGMRYGSNLVDAIDGDILTVTSRGWFCQTDQLSGTTPAAVWARNAAA